MTMDRPIQQPFPWFSTLDGSPGAGEVAIAASEQPVVPQSCSRIRHRPEELLRLRDLS